MYSRAVVEVCTDSQQSNFKTTALHFKTVDFAKFRQILSKLNYFAARVVFGYFVSFSSKTKSFLAT